MSDKPEGVKVNICDQCYNECSLVYSGCEENGCPYVDQALANGLWFTHAQLAELIRMEREEERERIAHRFDQEAADPRTKAHWADICRWVCNEILNLKPIDP